MDAKDVTEDIFNQTPIVGEKRESGKFTDRYSNPRTTFIRVKARLLFKYTTISLSEQNLRVNITGNILDLMLEIGYGENNFR